MLLSTSVRKKPVLLAARESGASGKKDAVGGWWKRGQGAIQRGLPGSSWSQLMGKDVVRTLRVS